MLAEQVLSQLSYTPTAGTTFILRHLYEFRTPFLCFSMIPAPKLYQNPRLRVAPTSSALFAPRQGSFRWLGA